MLERIFPEDLKLGMFIDSAVGELLNYLKDDNTRRYNKIIKAIGLKK